MSTIIPAPKRVIHIKPMMPEPRPYHETVGDGVREMASFVALMLFCTAVATVCLMIH
jgi:hypothetical protein